MEELRRLLFFLEDEGVLGGSCGSQSRPGVLILSSSGLLGCGGGVLSRRGAVNLSLVEIWRGVVILSLVEIWRDDTCCGGLFAAEWATASFRSPFTRFFGTDREVGSGKPFRRTSCDRSTCPVSSFGEQAVCDSF